MTATQVVECPPISADQLSLDNVAARADAFLKTAPPYPGTFQGRGIVTCAGGAQYLTLQLGC